MFQIGSFKKFYNLHFSVKSQISVKNIPYLSVLWTSMSFSICLIYEHLHLLSHRGSTSEKTKKNGNNLMKATGITTLLLQVVAYE